ncbi:MAG: transcription-repair coupling factor [Nitrospinae bacterium]|nr:transcription-repair coupling factor [Nitrospinota bacterium]
MNESISVQSEELLDSLSQVRQAIFESGQKVAVEGLRGAASAYFISRLHQLEKGRPVLIVTSDQNSAESLLEDLKYFFHYMNLNTKPLSFPSWELLPYEPLSPLNEISGERLEILNRLWKSENLFLVAPVEAIMQTVIPRNSLQKNVFTLRTNDELEREFLEASLADNGFIRSPLVENRCEFSVRGDIVDFFQSGADNPVRIEFFGDTIESIREFDIFSQISTNKLKSIDILPVRELCLGNAEIQNGLKKILKRSEEMGLEDSKTKETQEKIENLGFFSGMEFLAPFFFDSRETIFDYLPPNTVIALDEPDLLNEKSRQFEDLIQSEYNNCIDKGLVSSAPEELFLSTEELEVKFKAFHGPVILNSLKVTGEDAFTNTVEIRQIPQMVGNLDLFSEQILRWQNGEQKVVIVAPTKGQVRRIHELMNEMELEVDVDIGRLSEGFHFKSSNLVFVAEHEIFGRTHKHRHRRKSNSQSFQRGLKDLKKGDYLVHIDYGIGLYLGTKEIKTGLGSGEFLHIQYADDEKLYLPMEGLGFVQKYVGGSEAPPPLSKMGGIAWKRQKKKAKQAIEEMAGDLLKHYASREMAKGHSYSTNTLLVREFADSFEYEETDDQLKAIEEVENDLENDKPTDRLICGDVGYGKTEVAMRAAFKVVLDKKQVAVLVPTTILAQQHLQTFQERFKEYPVTIDMVNRFRTPREQKVTLEKLKKGEVDIIIGTHRLLSKDVEFASLGLIVVDEEQRFGVKHKEKLKKLRNSIDILTLTATPIPRTLHFSLMGVRDLSVIETPPLDRLAVKTFIRKFSEEVIREAILREVDRGGQVFFVHNKIHSIHSIAELIRRLVPGVRIDIAHGRLPEHQLENVMKNFLDKKVDVLLSTSIVESGLDIPSANTIIINRADQFGLAQLYQLRGRVGRYKHQAYAYLLIPGTDALSKEARKRLTAMEELSELGAGFQLAARDMEIRGVGNMLGSDQSGHIASVGFDLYCKLVEDMVKDIRGEKVEPRIETEIDLMIKGYIPNEYVPDLNQRLELYRRIQLTGNKNECFELSREMVDRYGPHPEPVEKLMALLEIRVFCQLLHISKAKMKNRELFLTLLPTTPLSPETLASLFDERLKMISEFQIGILLDRKGWKSDFKAISNYLQKLSESLISVNA